MRRSIAGFENDASEDYPLGLASNNDLPWGTWHVPLFRIVMALTGGAERALRDYLGSIARGLGEPARFE